MKSLENAPRIYVDTYGMYNRGSLFAKWFDLTDYADVKEFYQNCCEYHRNEFDRGGYSPEIVIQDWASIPDFVISECSLHGNAFKNFHAIDEMDGEKA